MEGGTGKKPKPKRTFKPKVKAPKIKDEVVEHADVKTGVNGQNGPNNGKKKGQKQQKPNPKQRNMIATAGIFDAVDVERRGTANQARFGGGTSSDLQRKAPIVKRDTKRWSKEENKKEEEETKKVLQRMFHDEDFIVHDPALTSDPDLMPIKVGMTLKEIAVLREDVHHIPDNDELFIEALHEGNSENIFLLQVSDLPLVPYGGDEDDYDPNEERLLGEVSASVLGQTATIDVGEVKMTFNSGTSSNFVQELARITASSFQIVGEVTKKLTLAPDIDRLLSQSPS